MSNQDQRKMGGRDERKEGREMQGWRTEKEREGWVGGKR